MNYGLIMQNLLKVFETFNPTSSFIYQITSQTKNNKPSDDELKLWITKNKQKLFNGEWTEKLVDLNKDTIDRGIKNETQAMDILKEKLGSNVQIRRFCSGSVQDTRMGQDLAVKIGDNEEFFVQVKPLKKVESKWISH